LAVAYSGAGAVVSAEPFSNSLRVWDGTTVSAELKGHRSIITAIHAVQGRDDLILSCDGNYETLLWELARPGAADAPTAVPAAPEAGDAPRLADFLYYAWCGFASDDTIVVVDSESGGGGVFAFSSAGPAFRHLWTQPCAGLDLWVSSKSAVFTVAGDARPTIAVSGKKRVALLDAATGALKGDAFALLDDDNALLKNIAVNAAGILVGVEYDGKGLCVSWDCAARDADDDSDSDSESDSDESDGESRGSGSTLPTARAGRRLSLRDLTGAPTQLATYAQHDHFVAACDVSAAGLVVTVGRSAETHVWDARTGICVFKIPAHGRYRALWLDESRVLLDAKDPEEGAVALVDIGDGTVRIFETHGDYLSDLSLVATGGGPRLLTAGEDGTVRLHDMANDTSDYVFYNHRAAAYRSVASQRNGTLIIAATTTAGIFVLDRAARVDSPPELPAI
jgi:WD40 repeat protein